MKECRFANHDLDRMKQQYLCLFCEALAISYVDRNYSL